MMTKIRAIAALIRDRAKMVADIARLVAAWTVQTADAVEAIKGVLDGNISSQQGTTGGAKSAPVASGSEGRESPSADAGGARPRKTGTGGERLPSCNEGSESPPPSTENAKEKEEGIL